ncbi:hypothetical protein NDU88_004736 [Pleurodeles waltl]|uniref:Uncharacterized protein n=1 Tax=Pleurodeles waltl TaxID=8319 RepID=A0AAV7NKI7_PLEWA|nr:hypothetical protein NDU88_004736 [Pleurodeles waltl]
MSGSGRTPVGRGKAGSGRARRRQSSLEQGSPGSEEGGQTHFQGHSEGDKWEQQWQRQHQRGDIGVFLKISGS